MRPLESFLREFQLHGKNNVQLLVPTDHYDETTFTFSAFAFMIRNSPFGHRILKHWDSFARGVCVNGNLNLTADGRYTWLDTDQPGLWYAMMRTYSDFFPERVPEGNYPHCNTTTGVLDKHSPPWNDFFRAIPNLTKGSTGVHLDKMPDDQPFVYSSVPNGQRSGLALQLNWGLKPGFTEKYAELAFALHLKDPSVFPRRMVDDITHCKRTFGCYAHYNDAGDFKIGCGDTVYQ